MILAVHRYELNRLTQYLQGIVQLNTLADRHIRVHRTMQQQQRGLDFIRIEQCSVFGKQVGIIPTDIASRQRQRSYRNSPNSPRPSNWSRY